MRRLLALALAGLAATGVLPADPAAAAPAPGGRVLIVSLPRVTWELIRTERPPVLTRFLDEAALASMSQRTIGPHTSAGEGYATIGAGNRATVNDLNAGLAFAPGETFEDGDAGDAFTRRTTRPATGAAALHVAMPSVAYENSRLLYGAEPGALGSALTRAGRSIAVIGNADTRLNAGLLETHREVALAGVDRDGRAGSGQIDSNLLVPDRASPFGVRLDPDAVETAFDRAWATDDVVILEASDLERADAYAGLATAKAGAQARRQALQAADRLLDHALSQVTGRDLVIVLSPATPRSREQLGIAAVSGPRFGGGWLRSATTRRDRYVTLPDIAPTILDHLGVEQPDAMTGALLRAGGDRPGVAAALARMADDSARTAFRDRATGPASVAFIVFQVLIYALAVVSLRWAPRLRVPVAFGALMTLALPTVAFLSGAVPYDGLGLVPYLVALLAAAAGLAAVARLAGGRNPLLPPLLLVAAVLVLLLVDAGAGAPLQINTVFGYSPVVAGRFAGYGNLASALLATAAIVVASGAWGLRQLGGLHRTPLPPGPDRELGSRTAVGLVAALLFIVIVFIGSPSLGSDVGGVLTTVPAFAVLVLLLSGVRVSGRIVAALAVATVVAIAGFAAIDLARPEADQTHLARLVRQATGDGSGGAATVIRRKAAANLSILSSSVWTYLIPAALAFLVFLVWRPRGFLQALQRRVPGLRAGLIGAVVAGVLGFSLNDSGVAVPAMMFAVLLPYLTYLLVTPSSPVDATAAPAGGTTAGRRRGAGR